MITIWGTGEYDYSDAGIDKPVRYTIENLIEVASRTPLINVTKEHDKEVLDVMENFIVEDGLLKAKEPSSLELKGMGFSPVFNFDLIDKGNYYEPTNIVMTEIGYTKTPRSHIVYNSIQVANEGNMEDKQLRQALEDNRKLQEEIGVYKKQISQLKKSNTEKDKQIKEIKESYSDVDTRLNEYEHLKEIETNYNTLISSKKDDLIHQIAGKDSVKAEKLQSWSIEQLEFQVELLSEPKPRGLTPQDTHVDGGNDPVPDDTGEDIYTDEMFKADFEASGL